MEDTQQHTQPNQHKEDTGMENQEASTLGTASSGQSTLQELQEKCEEYKTGWQRAQADYQNLKKEMEEKRKELAEWCKVQILEEVIPIYDNFKKANAHKPTVESKEWANWAQGIDFIMKQFSTLLTHHDIQEIKTVGEIFQPEFHDAVAEEVSETEKEHTIVREVEAGYKIGAKVIKPAKVVISTKQTE